MPNRIKKFTGIFIACLIVSSVLFNVSTSFPASSASTVEKLQQFDMEQVKITDP